MNFAEAHAALRALAGGLYFSVRVESTETADGTVEVNWSGYVGVLHPAPGWTSDFATPEEMLAAVRVMVGAKSIVDPDDALVAVGRPSSALRLCAEEYCEEHVGHAGPHTGEPA